MNGLITGLVKNPNHIKDEDCQSYIDPTTQCCMMCGVYHGDPCPVCNGNGFHKDNCPEIG